MSQKQVRQIEDFGVASEDIAQFTGVSLAGGVISYGDANEAIDGIVYADGKSGDDLAVIRQGLTTMKVATAAGITANSIATVNASGELVALAGASNTGNVLVLEAPSADGDEVQVYFDFYNLSNETAGA